MAENATADAATPAPEPGQGESAIQLGPNLDIYPEDVRPAPETSAPTQSPEAPAPAKASEPEPLPDAGPEPATDAGQQTRRQRGEDLYQRGLREGREQFEREQTDRRQREAAEQLAKDASDKVETLFSELESPDYATQDRARRAVLQMYRGNREASALQQMTRTQILQEMAADFSHLRDLDGVGDEDYQSLHTAPSAAALAERAFALGKKSREDQIAKLEAELQGLRGRLVGSRATPERANGSSPGLGNNVSLEQYMAMSPKDARSLSPAQIDALTAQLAAESANGRS